jgi:hypothetical protein
MSEPVFDSRVARRMGYHHAIACGMHLGADRLAQTTHSTRDECHAHCCPPNRCCVGLLTVLHLALDREGYAHTSADAQRCKPTLGVPLLHFMQKGH